MLQFVDEVFGDDLHAKRVQSLADASTGALAAASVGITAMGHGLGLVLDVDPEHAAKQIDRLLSNSGLVLDDLFASWTAWMVGERKAITVAMDWTEFDRDAHATLSLNLVTDHGRAIPLLWRTISTNDRKVERPTVEREVLKQLRRLVSEDVGVTLLGDRWFGNQDLYEHCYELGFDFIFRFRSIISVEDRHGASMSAKDWLGERKSRCIKEARVTGSRCWVGQVVLRHDKEMAEPWCLASSRGDLKAQEVVEGYGRRFTIEECFRDIKDDRTGFGLKEVRVKRTDRRDRLLFIASLTLALVTLLGAASERCGFDKKFSSKARLKRGRQYSLVRQGLHWLRALPILFEENARKIMSAFDEVLLEHPHASTILGLNK